MHSSSVAARGLARVLLAVLLLVLLVAPGASAQEGGSDVDVDDGYDPLADGELNVGAEVGDGTCSPAILGVEERTTCTFPLLGPDRGMTQPVVARIVARDGAEDLFASSSPCEIDGDALVCALLKPTYAEGEQEVGVAFFGTLDPEAGTATIQIDRLSDGVLGVVSSNRLPAVYAGAATIDVFRSFRLAEGDAADLLLRRLGEDEVLAQVPALVAGVDNATVPVPIDAPGLYTLTGCAVAADGDCIREGFRRVVQAVAPEALELIEGHNLRGANRIELVFVGSGVADPDRLASYARTLLSVDGEPVAVGDGGLTTLDDAPYALGWGPFAIDPFRGQQDRFNFWYLADDIAPDALRFSPGVTDPSGGTEAGEEAPVGFGPDPVALGLGPHVVLVDVSPTGPFVGQGRATASEPSFDGLESVPASLADARLGSVHLPGYFGETQGAELGSLLAHELGHALLGLRDEYVEHGLTSPTLRAPNCAADEPQAASWWGDLVGVVDPMVQRWEAVEVAAGVWYREADVRDLARVGYVPGGCYADPIVVDAAVRPTENGLMHDNLPFLGAVNRHRAEEVLARFSGRANFDPDLHAALVTATCTRDDERLHCTGELPGLLDLAGQPTLVATIDGAAGMPLGCDLAADGDPMQLPELVDAAADPARAEVVAAAQAAGLLALDVPDARTRTFTCDGVQVGPGADVHAVVAVGEAVVFDASVAASVDEAGADDESDADDAPESTDARTTGALPFVVLGVVGLGVLVLVVARPGRRG